MNAHSFLSFIQNHYDCKRADAILSDPNLKNYWKHWLTAELVHFCDYSDGGLKSAMEDYYPAKKSADREPYYLRYQVDHGVEIVGKKRCASRCDFMLSQQGKDHYYEIRCGSLLKKGDRLKLEADIVRVEALKKAHAALQMTVLFAFYGAFSSKQIEAFMPFDNSKRCSYLLDSGLQGSSSISRLTQMRRAGEPRLCLLAFSV